MSDANDWAATDLRRALLEKAAQGEPGAIPETLSVPSIEALNRLVDFLTYYDSSNPNLPDDPTQSFMYRWMIDRLESQMAWDATERGHLTRMRGLSGRQSNRMDATGYDKLVKAVRPAAQQVLIKGPKGSGKTTKAADIIRHLHSDFDGELKVLTNVEGMDDHPDVQFAEDISEFLEFAQTPGEKVALFDEFSTTGNAYVGQHEVEEVMSRVINAFRKSSGGSLRTFYIGHENDNDIHPLVKKQSDVVIRADGKMDEGLIDKATIYRGWDDYTSDDTWFSVRGLQDVDEDSPWGFDTNYFAHLEWNLDEPGKQIQRGRLIDNWESYQDSETTGEEGDDGAEPVKCHGVKQAGDGCPAMTKHESGFCYNHRAQWSGNDDLSENGI